MGPRRFMMPLCMVYQAQGRLDEAEQLLLRLLEIADDHTATMDGLLALATTYESLGRSQDAEQLLRQAIEFGNNNFGSKVSSRLLPLIGWA